MAAEPSAAKSYGTLPKLGGTYPQQSLPPPRDGTRDYKYHLLRLSGAKQTMKTDNPLYRQMRKQHENNKIAKKMAEERKQADIRRENIKLVNRIRELAVREPAEDLGGKIKPVNTMSLNFTGRKTEADRIRLENMRLAKRIIQQKPVIRHKDLRKFERKHKLLLQNLTRPVNYTSYDYGLDDRFKKIKPQPGIAGLLTLHTDQLPEMPGLSPPPKARTSKESKSTSHLPALSSSNNPSATSSSETRPRKKKRDRKKREQSRPAASSSSTPAPATAPPTTRTPAASTTPAATPAAAAAPAAAAGAAGAGAAADDDVEEDIPGEGSGGNAGNYPLSAMHLVSPEGLYVLPSGGADASKVMLSPLLDESVAWVWTIEMTDQQVEGKAACRIKSADNRYLALNSGGEVILASRAFDDDAVTSSWIMNEAEGNSGMVTLKSVSAYSGGTYLSCNRGILSMGGMGKDARWSVVPAGAP